MTELDFNFRAGCAGRYKLEKAKADSDGNEIPGTRELVTPWFNNVITDQGLDRIGIGNGSSGVYLNFCQVGTGNNPPAFTDTGLETYLAGVGRTGGSIAAQATPPYYGYCTLSYQFGTGAAAGNLSEVGIGWAASGSFLFSRALIVDGTGTPTTITILSDEILIVYYEYRIYPPLVDVTGTIDISGVSYSYTARAASVTSAGSWGLPSASLNGTAPTIDPGISYANSGILGPITGAPTGGGSNSTASSGGSPAYVPGTLSRDSNITWNPASRSTSITAFLFRFISCQYQMEVSPAIPKTSLNQLTLNMTVSWARATIP